MKLSIITDEVSQDLDEAAKFALAHGLRFVAIRSVWGTNVANLELPALQRIRQRLDKYGLRVSSILSPLLKCHGPQTYIGVDGDPHFVGFSIDYNDHVALAPRLPMIAKIMDAPSIRIFGLLKGADYSPHVAIQEATADWPRGLCAIENEHTCSIGTLAELAEACTQNSVRAVIDPCNHRRLQGSLSAADISDDLIAAAVDVHVKDVRNDNYVPLGEGVVDWQGILDRLAERRYAGFVTLESHLRGNRQGLTDSIVTLTEWTSKASAAYHPSRRMTGHEIGSAMWLDAASLGGR